MMYLSKGLPCKRNNGEGIQVNHFGRIMCLKDITAVVWLKGKYDFAFARTSEEKLVLKELEKSGLAESSLEETRKAGYYILTRCILYPYPIKSFRTFWPLTAKARWVLSWLKKSGMYLNIAELIYLRESRIEPTKEFLSEPLRLIKCLYPTSVISGNELENRMANALQRDEIVGIVLWLVRKKLICIV